MEKRSKRRLDFNIGYVHHEGVVLPKMKSKMVVSNYTKRFSNNLYLLVELRPSARTLLDFMTENMTGENVVYTNSTARDEFISFISFVTKGSVNYSDNTVKKSLVQLTKLGLLIQMKRGSMMINPEYFYKGNEEDRMRSIRELYEADLVVPLLEDLMEPPKPESPSSMNSGDDPIDYDDLLSRIQNS